MKVQRYQRSFSEPALSPMLFEFLETIFPGISRITENSRILGASWESVSTPFVHFIDGRIISHVGVLELPLVLMGTPVVAAGIHGVATDPKFRRQGYYRKIMDEVMQYCDAKYETLVLTTEQPAYYESFGFRVIPEHVSIVKNESAPGENGFRQVNLQHAADRELLPRLLDTREPVSQILGVVREKAVFCFNEASRPMFYSGSLDAMACMEIEGETLRLYDLVATRIPSLKVILEQLPVPITEVQIYFAPDRMKVNTGQSRPYLLENTCLMARGPFAAEGQICMLPHSARC